MNEVLKNDGQRQKNQFNQPEPGTLSGFTAKFFKNLQTEFEKANKSGPK